ncbi:catechol 1,2-dioxygenase [Azospirillum sp. B4]|uniref:catechol 1,2-dioxygenase n=1 Tax=Azospirillum sp. B4 TaxID=95605 RepID=UPI000345913C|nr:catechol 1,2-dioxygenase [Azospirillum sp. B4]
MTALDKTLEIQAFLDQVAGIANGEPTRLKKIVRRIVGDLFATIEAFDVTDDEFWQALNFVGQSAPEFGLWAAGFGVEHFLDVRADRADAEAGTAGGTPRTIEGPLYVAGAPLERGRARLDDGSDAGEVLVMHGRVLSTDGQPIPDAIVDVWHANTLGNYSHFDTSQSAYNYRRRIQTDAEGRYWFRSILPSGYAVPPGSGIERALSAIGRHGNRPAHIHFFVSAAGHRHLTTQINIEGDAYLHDDFAYATRDDLIPPVSRVEDIGLIHAADLNAPFAEIAFDFILPVAMNEGDEGRSSRPRALVD